MTQTVLASEIYDMINGFNLGFVIKQTFATLCKRIDLAKILLILYTNSYLLYQCLVQLGTTLKKQLIIDIMTLILSYKEKEIDKIRWICGKDNPADAMTKALPNLALKRVITTNKVIIRLKGWVKQ